MKKNEKTLIQQSTRRKKIRKSRADWIFDIAIYTVAVLLIFLCLYPVYFVVIASISNPSMVGTGKVVLWPKGITFEAYKKAFAYPELWIGYRNTIFYTIGYTFMGLFVNVTAGYAMSRNLPGKKLITVYYMIPMFFGGGLVPTFLLVNQLGLVDTPWVIIIPFSVSTYNILVARTFFRTSIPEELWDSAQIDGCRPIPYFIKVVMPLSKAIFAVLGLWLAVAQWNQYYTALVYLRNENLTTLQLVLRGILIANRVTEEGSNAVQGVHGMTQQMADLIKYALIVISTAPIMCLYPFVQKYFNQGVMLGSVKG